VYFEHNVFYCGSQFLSVPQVGTCVTVSYSSSLSLQLKAFSCNWKQLSAVS